jgi:hypothetical protein
MFFLMFVKLSKPRNTKQVTADLSAMFVRHFDLVVVGWGVQMLNPLVVDAKTLCRINMQAL